MPKLHIANAFFEWELEAEPKVSLREAFLQHPIYLQLQFLPVLYADGPVLLTDAPSPEYWTVLQGHGIDIPVHFTLDDDVMCDAIESWGPSQLIAEWAAVHDISYSIPDWRIVKEVNSKRFSFENSPKLLHAVLLTEETQAKAWLRSFPGPKVLKSCFGVSGRGHLLIEDLPWERIVRFLHAEWKKELPVIAEPWVERLLDFSTQWEIHRQIVYLGSTICQNDGRGQYQYNEVGDENVIFGKWLPFLIEHRKQVEPLLTAMANRGFFGNVGIDAMIYGTADNPVLHPVVEINARKTMGWVALVFQQRYFPHAKVQLRYMNEVDGYLPNSLVLKNGKRVSFSKNLNLDFVTF